MHLHNKKVLVMGLYPITTPQHGGQKRAKAIFNLYRTLSKDIRYVGIYHRALYSNQGSHDILLGDIEVIKKIDENPHSSEMIMGSSADKDIHVRSHLAKLLIEYQPHIIHIEQPYLYAGIRPLLKELDIKPIIIYGSQNIEFKMKQSIHEKLGIVQSVSKPMIKEIKKLEYGFSKEADLVLAVSKQDAVIHRQMGARRVVIVPNGIEKKNPTKGSIEFWKRYKKEKSIKNLVSFIASGHPPNWIGFESMLGGDIDLISKESALVIAGGVSEYFRDKYPEHSNFWRYVSTVGRLSEDRLSGLLYESSIFLLPITSGGGSNLKTAEAILSGKKVVGTSFAFRGFEKYKELPNIYITDKPEEFKKLLVLAINTPLRVRNAEEIKLAESVQWKYCLRPLAIEVKKMIIRQQIAYIIKNSIAKIRKLVKRMVIWR